MEDMPTLTPEPTPIYIYIGKHVIYMECLGMFYQGPGVCYIPFVKVLWRVVDIITLSGPSKGSLRARRAP